LWQGKSEMQREKEGEAYLRPVQGENAGGMGRSHIRSRIDPTTVTGGKGCHFPQGVSAGYLSGWDEGLRAEPLVFYLFVCQQQQDENQE
jgi:predicted DNA-binding transcriptional regulator AlpA